MSNQLERISYAILSIDHLTLMYRHENQVSGGQSDLNSVVPSLNVPLAEEVTHCFQFHWNPYRELNY